ncbi:MAG TPA: hypothetical protein VK081_14665 [Planctomycetota bacterium]|nr:hypothetical protein [Planctomycetota bacterium]
MADPLDKVLDIAKKLRKAAKKVTDPSLQSLITDLNLSLADLRVQLVEQRAAERAPAQDSTPATASSAQANVTVLRGLPG